MSNGDLRKQRIERMAKLARVYRGWSASQLCDALGREPSRVAPSSGNPKLDLVARLAEALDWELGHVAESVWEERCVADGDAPASRARGFAALDAEAQELHRGGAFRAMERVGLAMRHIARTGRERAIAANRLAGAYDGFGRYARVLDCVREGLAERNIGADIRTMLTVNLANANYTLWNLHEARAISDAILENIAAGARDDVHAAAAPRARIERVAEAFGHALRGHSRRRLIATADSQRESEALAILAAHDLRVAAGLYANLFDDFGDAQYAGLAETARGGELEARVAAGEIAAEDALEQVLERIDRVVDLGEGGLGEGDGLAGDSPVIDRPVIEGPLLESPLIESCGWWSVFGANIAMRAGDADAAQFAERSGLEQALAICTNKAADIAEHLDHWPMRERAFTLEWFRRQTIGRFDPAECAAWTLDSDDVRVLVGTMGRFPLFRATGWAILDRAVIAASGA